MGDMDLSWVESVVEVVARVGIKLVLVAAVFWVIHRVGTRLHRRAARRLTWPRTPSSPEKVVTTELSLHLDHEAAVALCADVVTSFDGTDVHVLPGSGSTLVQGFLAAGPAGLPALVLQLEVADHPKGALVRISSWPVRGFGWRPTCEERVRAVRAEVRAREQVALREAATVDRSQVAGSPTDPS
jgi:hypothetical protein